MEINKSFLLAYLEVIAGLKNSGILASINHRTDETEDAYDFLFLPVCRLDSIYVSMLQDNFILDAKKLECIASDSNAVWYAIDCRSDIPNMIPRSKFDLSIKTCKILSTRLGRIIPSQMSIFDVHQLAGEIEIYIREHLL